MEGWQVWSLSLRLGGQVRMISGGAGAVVIGFDMTAALALAAASGVPAVAVAEFLPAIEAAMVCETNKRMANG